jgi:aspartate/methionine/tyrosine aminotransferase
MNPQAAELNQILRENSPNVFEMLSARGKEVYFPKKGILGQSAAAKGKRIDATIGTAVEDDKSPMRLQCIQKNLNIAPANAFPYAPSYGRPDIRSKWKEMIYEKNPGLKGVEISLPVVTNALTHGLSMVGYLFLDKTDKVIMPDFNWDNYGLTFTNAYGAEIETFNTFLNGEFDAAAMKKALMAGGTGKKVLLLNFPNNPTGYTPSVKSAKAIVDTIKEVAEAGNKVVVFCDDAYFGLVFEDGIELQSIFTYLSTLHENVLAVKVDGPTKEDYVWGFRVGFISYAIKGGNAAMYTALADKTAGAVRGNISNSSNLSQALLVAAWESKEYQEEKQAKHAILKKRYNKVKEVISGGKYDKYFKALPFNSGYFMCVKPAAGIDPEAVRQILLNEFETGVICLGDILRVAFSAVGESDIPELFENIYKACDKYATSKA